MHACMHASTVCCLTLLLCLFFHLPSSYLTRASTSDDLGFVIIDSILQSHPNRLVKLKQKNDTPNLLRGVVSVVFEVLPKLHKGLVH